MWEITLAPAVGEGRSYFSKIKFKLPTFISEDLGPLDMIIVVVAEEEISDGSLGHCSDFRQHCL